MVCLTWPLSRGYVVKDVPHNGSTACSLQFSINWYNAGVEFEENTLREQLVEYFEDPRMLTMDALDLSTFIGTARDPVCSCAHSRHRIG